MTRRLGVTTAVLLSVTCALAVGYCRVFPGWDWLPDMLAVAVVTHTVSGWGNRRPVPFALSGLLAAAAGYWITALMQLRDTLWYGLPLGRTVSAVNESISAAWGQVGEVVPPLPFASGFGLAAMFSLVFVAIVGDAFTNRAAGRAEALIPSSLVFVVVSAVGGDRNRVVISAVTVLVGLNAVAVLRRLDSRASRTDRHSFWSSVLGVSMATMSALVGAVVAPLLPGAYAEPLLSDHGGDQKIVDPMVDVRGRLFDQSDNVLFTVAADVPTYWRLTALPQFDGEKWGIPQSDLDRAGGQLASIDEPLPGDTVTSSYQSYDIVGLAGSLVPASFEPVQLRASTRSLFYALDPGALVVTGNGLLATDAYEIVSKVVNPSYVNLLSADVVHPPADGYLSVPDTPAMIDLRDVAQAVTVDASNPYQKAIELQNWFRTEFTYSLDVPAGDGTDATLQFLDRRTGYCEQFSSTMALFARLLGIPARVAIGFTPGDRQADGTYVVRSQHAHAWPELWFDDIGWVLFEPTPGRGAPNADYTGVSPQQDDSAPVTTTTTTSTTTPDTTSPTSDSIVPTTTATSTVDSGDGNGPQIPGWMYIIAMVAMWSLFMPSLVGRLASDDSVPLLLRWRRVLAVYAVTGNRPTKSSTPLEIGAMLPEKPGLDEQLVGDLAAAVTQLVYSTRPRDIDLQLIERADEWLRGAYRRLDRRHRIRRRIDPLFVWRLNR